MRRALAVALLTVLAGPGIAQTETVTRGAGAVLRGLDKVDGTITDVTLDTGGAGQVGRLTLELGECRYPKGDAARDAYAYLTIRDTASGDVFFAGWMIASSPALNALEHPRYDVWVLRCTTN